MCVCVCCVRFCRPQQIYSNSERNKFGDNEHNHIQHRRRSKKNHIRVRCVFLCENESDEARLHHALVFIKFTKASAFNDIRKGARDENNKEKKKSQNKRKWQGKCVSVLNLNELSTGEIVMLNTNSKTTTTKYYSRTQRIHTWHARQRNANHCRWQQQQQCRLANKTQSFIE